jgi:hypothetical protein
MKYFLHQSNYELYKAVKRVKTELKLTWRDIALLAEVDEKRLYKWISLHKKGRVSGALLSEHLVQTMAERLGIKLAVTVVQEPMAPQWKRQLNSIISDRKYRNTKQRTVQSVSRITRVYRQARG